MTVMSSRYAPSSVFHANAALAIQGASKSGLGWVMVMVWCSVVWGGGREGGVAWCGVVWCGVVWRGVVWCGVAWRGVAWRGVAWRGWRGVGGVAWRLGNEEFCRHNRRLPHRNKGGDNFNNILG